MARGVPTMGYPHPDLAGGTYLGQGVPALGVPPVLTWPGGTYLGWGGYLPWGTPSRPNLAGGGGTYIGVPPS